MTRVSYDEMYSNFIRVLVKMGYTQDRAELSAKLFADASRDGVYTHGLNRFVKFIASIKNGCVDINAVPTKVQQIGAIERWDGNRGPGNLNAYFCMDRAIEIAQTFGIGCVALKNTNHWMRPGAYGLQAADKGCIGICWTNTVPNMPPWGAKEAKLGNNPIVMAVPKEGGHILLDMAVSMFSYGKLESYARRDEMLPVEGGFDKMGNATKNAKDILETKQTLPIGYWKGSGFSLLLDLIAMVLAGGNSSYEVGKLKYETDLSQTFIAVDLTKFSDQDFIARAVKGTIDDLHSAEPVKEGGKAYYPGERMMMTRNENIEKGIPVEDGIWQQVLDM